MTKEYILNFLKDINFMYNNANMYDDLERMLDELIEEGEQPCEDCISRSELKRRLQEYHDFFVNAYDGYSNMPRNDKARVDEIANCIAEIVNMPSVQPIQPCEDAVSREAIKKHLKSIAETIDIKEIGGDYNTGFYDGLEFAIDYVITLPSVQPERVRGAWEYDGDCIHCTKCKKAYGNLIGFNFCPDCGADMRGEPK